MSAIVSKVVPGSQAERAGLQRGDVLCYGGSDGTLEINYNQFLAMARSPQRPLTLDIRRIVTKASPSAVGAGYGSSMGGGRSSAGRAGGGSADAEARRKAVIAAAEARERKHKAKERPMAKVASRTKKDDQGAESVLLPLDDTPQSDEARRAIQAAKSGENQLAAQLGYNPYETNKVTAGQARNATVATKHGSVQGGAGDTSSYSGAGSGNIPTVAPPRDAFEEAPSLAFQDALETLLTSGGSYKGSLTVMRKLMVNATTKGQTDEKFRKVRLTNAKIQAAITDVHGALDCMMAVGFQLTELEGDGEPYLVYPPGDKGPSWLPSALKQMERHEK